MLQDLNEITDWEHEKVRYGNNLVLTSSTQGAVAAGAGLTAIAWAAEPSDGGISSIDIVAVFSFIACIVGSVFTHLLVGLAFIRMANKELGSHTYRPPEKTVRGSVIAGAWLTGGVQLVAFTVGLVCLLLRVPTFIG